MIVVLLPCSFLFAIRTGTARLHSGLLSTSSLAKVLLLVLLDAAYVAVVPQPDVEPRLNPASWFGDFAAIEPA